MMTDVKHFTLSECREGQGSAPLGRLITPLHAIKTKTQVSDRICMRILKRIYKTITESN